VWCVVCGVWCVVCGIWCVACGVWHVACSMCRTARTLTKGICVWGNHVPLRVTQAPTAVRYAWGDTDCCDITDPDLMVTHGCVANCPIMSSSNLPANPFMSKIVGGKCQCIAPQVCNE
jgi:hypothetical protein